MAGTREIDAGAEDSAMVTDDRLPSPVALPFPDSSYSPAYSFEVGAAREGVQDLFSNSSEIDINADYLPPAQPSHRRMRVEMDESACEVRDELLEELGDLLLRSAIKQKLIRLHGHTDDQAKRLVDQLLSVFVLDTVGRVLTCTPMFASEDDGEIENAQLDMAASFRRYIAQLGDCPGQPAVEWTITHIFRPEVFPLIKEGARPPPLGFAYPHTPAQIAQEHKDQAIATAYYHQIKALQHRYHHRQHATGGRHRQQRKERLQLLKWKWMMDRRMERVRSSKDMDQ